MPLGAAEQLQQTTCRVDRGCLPLSVLFLHRLLLGLVFYHAILPLSSLFFFYSSSSSSMSYFSVGRLLRSPRGRRPRAEEINKELSLSPLPSSGFEWFPRQEVLCSFCTLHSHEVPCHVGKDQLLSVGDISHHGAAASFFHPYRKNRMEAAWFATRSQVAFLLRVTECDMRTGTGKLPTRQRIYCRGLAGK